MIGAAAKAKLLVFAVFIIGAVTGAVVEKVYETRSVDADATPQKTAERRTQEVQDYLGLNAEQRQQWDSIFRESRPEVLRLIEENRKLTAPNQLKMEELQDQTRSKIRAIMTTDEQRKKYEEHNERMRRQRQMRQQPRPRPDQK